MRTLLLRSLIAVGLVAGLAAAFVAGIRYDASPPRPSAGPHTAVTPVALTVDGCDALLDSYVQRGLELVGPYGWGGGGFAVPLATEGDVRAPMAASADAGAALPSTVRATNEDTGTNVQEAGVDEPDLVKTDGSHLYRVDGDDLVSYDVSGAEVVRLGSVDLPGAADWELLLSDDTVVAIGSADDATTVVTLDVSDPSAPVQTHVAAYDSRLVTARLHGGVVRLVLQAGLPELDFTQPDDHTTDHEATEANEAAVRASDLDDWLPTVSYDGGSVAPLLDCTQVAIPDDETPLGTLAVVGFDAFAPQTPSTTGLATDTDLVYASSDQLYVATSPYAAWPIVCGRCITPEPFPVPQWLGGDGTDPAPTVPSGGEDGTSHVYAFDLDDRATTLVADGTVDGVIRDRWSMDAHDGVLRLAVGPSIATGNENSLVTLRQEGDDLVEAGRLDDLGVDEDIQSVRWFDDLAIVVTYRQVDPLYAISLTDPSHPTLLGELKIPGFSAYLHPLGERRLLGLGEGPTANGQWGAQAGLFDVTDLTAPKQLDVVSYGPNTQALATTDPRQLTWLPDGRRVLSVVTDYDAAYVSVLTVGDGELADRMVEVEHGPEMTEVRLVPVQVGRVVLVTGDDVSFFAL